jgi:hypothetical protein
MPFALRVCAVTADSSGLKVVQGHWKCKHGDAENLRTSLRPLKQSTNVRDLHKLDVNEPMLEACSN